MVERSRDGDGGSSAPFAAPFLPSPSLPLKKLFSFFGARSSSGERCAHDRRHAAQPQRKGHGAVGAIEYNHDTVGVRIMMAGVRGFDCETVLRGPVTSAPAIIGSTPYQATCN